MPETKPKKAKKLNLNKCRVCGKKIQTMCFRGTGYCCQKCEKARA